MKKKFCLLIILCLLVGCGKKEEETTYEKKEVKEEVSKDVVLLNAKNVLTAAKAQYEKNILNGTYEAYGSVGNLPIDTIYVGVWNYSEDLKDIVIQNVEIDGYICSGSIDTLECNKK